VKRFLAHFMLLSVISGVAIGAGRILTTLYALHLGATPIQLGLIAGTEAAGKLLVTLPAGFLIHRFGARTVYSIATIGSMLLTLIVPWMRSWYGVAVARGLVSLCVPFRVVAMNSSFLHRLSEFGSSKAGWYRGSQTVGLLLLGPTIGTFLVTHAGYEIGFVVLSLLFAFMAGYSRVFLPDMDDASNAEAAQPSRFMDDIGSLLRHLAIRESCIVEFVTASLTSMFTTFIIVLAMNVGKLSQEQAVALVLVQGIAAVVALFLLGNVLSLISPRAAHFTSFVSAGAGVVVLGTSHTFAFLILGTVLMSIGTALIHLLKMNQLSRVDVSKSKLAGLYNLVGMAGTLVGATLGGIIAEHFGLQLMFLSWIPWLVLTALFCRRSV